MKPELLSRGEPKRGMTTGGHEARVTKFEKSLGEERQRRRGEGKERGNSPPISSSTSSPFYKFRMSHFKFMVRVSGRQRSQRLPKRDTLLKEGIRRRGMTQYKPSRRARRDISL